MYIYVYVYIDIRIYDDECRRSNRKKSNFQRMLENVRVIYVHLYVYLRIYVYVKFLMRI
jgi:hypothetical protein